MDTSPPVGSPPATLPCGPCEGQPTNCLVDVQTLHQQYCDLKTNYLSVLQKLAILRSALANMQLMFNDILGDIANLQKQIDDANGTDCSRLGAATTPDALIVCESGVQKNLAASTTNGFGLVSKDSKWISVLFGGSWYPAPANTFLFVNAGAGNQVVTFPVYPTDKTNVFGVFLSGLFVTNGSGSGQLLLNGQTLNFKRAFGSNADGNYLYSIAKINATETFNLVSVGGAVLNTDLQLLGYLAAP